MKHGQNIGMVWLVGGTHTASVGYTLERTWFPVVESACHPYHMPYAPISWGCGQPFPFFSGPEMAQIRRMPYPPYLPLSLVGFGISKWNMDPLVYRKSWNQWSWRYIRYPGYIHLFHWTMEHCSLDWPLLSWEKSSPLSNPTPGGKVVAPAKQIACGGIWHLAEKVRDLKNPAKYLDPCYIVYRQYKYNSWLATQKQQDFEKCNQNKKWSTPDTILHHAKESIVDAWQVNLIMAGLQIVKLLSLAESCCTDRWFVLIDPSTLAWCQCWMYEMSWPAGCAEIIQFIDMHCHWEWGEWLTNHCLLFYSPSSHLVASPSLPSLCS